MRQYIQTLFFVLAACGLYSCKKAKNENSPIPTDYVISSQEYTQLKIGNYWVYDQIYYDHSGNSTDQGFYDSTYVPGDTTINNATYFILVHKSNGVMGIDTLFVRDSLSYLVNNTGNILFSAQDFTDTFSAIRYINPWAGITDTITVTYQMGDIDSIVTVPAGTFKTLALKKEYHLIPPFNQYGNTKSGCYRYAKGIGMVSGNIDIINLTSPANVDYSEEQLISYHVQ